MSSTCNAEVALPAVVALLGTGVGVGVGAGVWAGVGTGVGLGVGAGLGDGVPPPAQRGRGRE
jgi:hypothetical protein